MTRKFVALIGLLVAVSLFSVTSSSQEADVGDKNEVIVLGMIHSGHKTSEAYSLDYLRKVIEEIEPDYVLTEIPPDRLAEAAAGFAKTGEVTEDRVRVFPEYVDVLFPLTKTMDFSIIPTAGWTRGMANYRREALNRLSEDPERAEDWAAYEAGFASMNEQLAGRRDDPFFIHTDEYDAITKEGFHPYATRFADDLGRGDWERINAAHYLLIEAALLHHQYEGKRLLITYGAAHKYWFLEHLRQRDDIILLDPIPFLQNAKGEQGQ